MLVSCSATGVTERRKRYVPCCASIHRSPRSSSRSLTRCAHLRYPRRRTSSRSARCPLPSFDSLPRLTWEPVEHPRCVSIEGKFFPRLLKRKQGTIRSTCPMNSWLHIFISRTVRAPRAETSRPLIVDRPRRIVPSLCLHLSVLH